ncbi:MAG: hypothetical protein J0I43_00065 [Microbacterium sp.]|uniref:hypothetical protein n=1 Tax=Microbacterium sp. TaxID=51671 RepID=UPI001ACFB7BE|nr:hypothetical protein [Microbacterium sp.]MBN9175754.1 hypothetical protein [Microbacterium sp.]
MSVEAYAAFEAYTERVVTAARAHPEIVGVALVGSGAEPHRIDAWSDHDLVIVATSAAVDALRTDLAWLPDATELAGVAREWHDGFKGIFVDGRIIEFAVTDLDELSSFPINRGRVVYDTGGVREAIEVAASATPRRPVSDAAALMLVFIVQLAVGVGRARRGEILSAGQVVRSEAVQTLLDLCLEVAENSGGGDDPFDPRRRFELAEPTMAREIADAMIATPEDAARALLEIADARFGHHDTWPVAAAAALRRKFGW